MNAFINKIFSFLTFLPLSTSFFSFLSSVCILEWTALFWSCLFPVHPVYSYQINLTKNSLHDVIFQHKALFQWFSSLRVKVKHFSLAPETIDTAPRHPSHSYILFLPTEIHSIIQSDSLVTWTYVVHSWS